MEIQPTENPYVPGVKNEYPFGWSTITREEDRDVPMHMDFSIVKFKPNEMWRETNEKETAWILLKGESQVSYSLGKATQVERKSLFDEAPWVLHLGPGTPVTLQAGTTGSEWAVARTKNIKKFEAHLFTPTEITTEHRGHNLVQGACARFVRLAFDKNNRPDANLVVGEVINQPGRWSSYPPHHHNQPEIYHYRFTEPQGYGHAEVGDKVFKIFNSDTIKIPGGLDHAQVSAPGYGMYYLWVVRHLENNPYTGFEFTEEHKWTLNPELQGWRPKSQ